MGYRTVVILYNDQAHQWEKDPELGQKIATAMHSMERNVDIGYGNVAECVHADEQTLGVIDGYHLRPLAHSTWGYNSNADETNIKMLKLAAEKLGFRLTKFVSKLKKSVNPVDMTDLEGRN